MSEIQIFPPIMSSPAGPERADAIVVTPAAIYAGLAFLERKALCGLIATHEAAKPINIPGAAARLQAWA